MSVEIIMPVLLICFGETEDEANERITEAMESLRWHEDAKAYLTGARVDESR